MRKKGKTRALGFNLFFFFFLPLFLLWESKDNEGGRSAEPENEFGSATKLQGEALDVHR